MPTKWAGELRGRMYRRRISVRELAEAAGLSYTYVSEILSGRRYAPMSQQRMEAAYKQIVEARKLNKKRPFHGPGESASLERPAYPETNLSKGSIS